ncbi:MAG: hypothetical protein V3T83_17140 [Acidobacteriota bacterium]
MTERSLPQSDQSSPPDDGKPTPSEVCLTEEEWQEISDCSHALYASIHCCQGLEGDEPAELVKSVQMRLECAVARIGQRIFGD